MKYVAAAGVLVAALIPAAAAASSGGTDEFGCHTETATGIYHCHGGGGGAPGKERNAVIGYTLLTLGTGGLFGALFYGPTAHSGCETVPGNQVCWPMAGVWTLLLSSVVAVSIGTYYVLPEEQGSRSFALSAPLMIGRF